MTDRRRVGEAELHAFVDGELAPYERAEVEAHLAGAPADQALVQELRELNDALRAHYADSLAGPLPAALAARFARAGRAWTGLPLRRTARPAAVLMLVLGAAAAGYLARGTPGPEPEAAFVATALGAHRIYVPEQRHAVEVRAGEAHLVRWLAKRVGADLRAPALAPLGWKLMGGRLLPGEDGLPAAQFMYEGGDGRRLTLYIRRTGRDNLAFRFYERDGVGAFYWIDQPLAYALAGRLSRRELTTLAHAVYRQLEGQK